MPSGERDGLLFLVAKGLHVTALAPCARQEGLFRAIGTAEGRVGVPGEEVPVRRAQILDCPFHLGCLN